MNVKIIRFMMLFDCELANPNGDPFGGTPRIVHDDKVMMTNWSIKHKIRKVLYDEGYEVLHYTEDDKTIKEKLDINEKTSTEEQRAVAEKYIDYRLFGAFDKGGPVDLVQKGAVSIQHPITYDSVNTEPIYVNRSFSVAKNTNGANIGSSFGNEFQMIDYGLFHAFGKISPKQAIKSNLRETDIELLREVIPKIFDDDASCMRPAGSMKMRKLVWWESEGYTYSDEELEKSVIVKKKEEVDIPRSYNDYEIEIKKLEGITTKITQ